MVIIMVMFSRLWLAHADTALAPFWATTFPGVCWKLMPVLSVFQILSGLSSRSNSLRSWPSSQSIWLRLRSSFTFAKLEELLLHGLPAPESASSDPSSSHLPNAILKRVVIPFDLTRRPTCMRSLRLLTGNPLLAASNTLSTILLSTSGGMSCFLPLVPSSIFLLLVTLSTMVAEMFGCLPVTHRLLPHRLNCVTQVIFGVPLL